MKGKLEFEYHIQANNNEEEKEINYYENTNTQVTDRTLEEYKSYLGLPLENLRGKRVLDIGSGQKESFSKQAAKFDIEVISLSPDLNREEVREQLTKGLINRFKWQKKSVAGVVQELPFEDGVFDVEVSLFAFPFHIPESEIGLKKGFQEIIRTLKTGGTAYLYPIRGDQTGVIKAVLEDFSGAIEFKTELVRGKEWEDGGQQEYRLTIHKNI